MLYKQHACYGLKLSKSTEFLCIFLTNHYFNLPSPTLNRKRENGCSFESYISTGLATTERVSLLRSSWRTRSRLRTTGRFRFLDLPAELRNKVYSYLAQETDPPARKAANLSHRINIAILLVNYQIATEAIEVFHQQLTLKLRYRSCDWIWFLERVAEHPVVPYPNPRRIYVQISAREFSESGIWGSASSELALVRAFSKYVQRLVLGLLKMPNLEILDIEYEGVSEHGRYTLCPSHAMELFTILRGLRKFSIVGDLKEDYAQWIIAAMKLPKTSNPNDYAVRPEGKISEARFVNHFVNEHDNPEAWTTLPTTAPGTVDNGSDGVQAARNRIHRHLHYPRKKAFGACC